VELAGLALRLVGLVGDPPCFTRGGRGLSHAPLSPTEIGLLDSFLTFRELAQWEWLETENIFGIEDPSSGQVNWATVMGAGGGLFGLGLYLGERGHHLLRLVVSGEADYVDVAYGQEAMLVTVSDWIEADEASVERWRAVWPEFREDAAVPHLESHAFGRIPRAVDEGEVAVLARALRQVVQLAERVRDGELELERAGDSPWLVRRWSDGKAVDPDFGPGDQDGPTPSGSPKSPRSPRGGSPSIATSPGSSRSCALCRSSTPVRAQNACPPYRLAPTRCHVPQTLPPAAPVVIGPTTLHSQSPCAGSVDRTEARWRTGR
jgi:hypothetical protein